MADPIYGNYRGKVVDVQDPDKKGRIKVQVYPFWPDIEAIYLPWCVPAMPLFEGAGNNVGSLIVPKVDTYVWVFFEAGDLYQPVYFAEANDFVHGIPIESATNYPDRKVRKTLGGLTWIVDDSVPSVSLLCENGFDIVIDQSIPSITISNGSLSFAIDGSVPSITFTHPSASITISSTGVITINGAELNINTP